MQGDGLQTRDSTFVDSVTDIRARAAVGKLSSDMPVNPAFGSRRTLLDVISELEAILGRQLPVEHLPARVGDVRDSQAGNDRLRALFAGAEPAEFSEGLRAAVEWFLGAETP